MRPSARMRSQWGRELETQWFRVRKYQCKGPGPRGQALGIKEKKEASVDGVWGGKGRMECAAGR